MPPVDSPALSGSMLTVALRSLVERLGEGPIRFRALGALYLLAAPLTWISLVVGHHARDGTFPIAVLGAMCVVFGVVLIAMPERLPERALPAMLAAGAVMASLGIAFSRDATSPYAFFYVWVAVEAFFFLGGSAALRLVGFIGVCYAAALLAVPSTAGDAVVRWLFTVGACLVSSVMAGVLQARAQVLLEEASEAARTDALTGLLNRRGFEETIALELARTTRSGAALSVVIVDLDHFKALNDRFGHQAGDVALQRLATLCRDGKRVVDSAARIGGEEFALVLPYTDANGAYLVAERLRRLIHDRASDETMLTASFGIAAYPEHGTDEDALLRAADQALYVAKQLGRDRSVIFSHEVAATVHQGLDVPLLAREQTTAVLVLAETLDLRDAGTGAHSQTVGRYSEMIARELGLPAERIERIRLAGLLHDIGKLGVPDEILRKPGRLSETEFTEIRKHPELGARILAGANLDDISGWVLAHHERPDGAGYPFGLSAGQIPLEARILAVADAFEAMTADRVYRAGMPHDAAVEELRRCCASQFDETVVHAFLRRLGSPVRSAFDAAF
jgi:diguanylate cyclase (GGDEF)-like protein/putative nucleotidyltransferase with HDIG domain